MCENASAEAAFLQGAGPETSLSFAAGEDSCLSAGRLCPTQLLPEYIQHPPGRPPGILTLSTVKTPTSTTAQSTLNRALCCWRQTPKETAMVKQVKGGYLLRHKKRLFGKAWREEWVVLYEDSTLAWFKEKGRGEPEGTVLVKDAPELLAVSHWSLRIPCRPDLPGHCHVTQVMAFGTRRRDKVHWFLAQSEDEVNDWMTAISNTLPPPPQPVKLPDEKTGGKSLEEAEARLPPTIPYYTSIPGEVPPPYTIATSDGGVEPEYAQISEVVPKAQQNGHAAAPDSSKVVSGLGDVSTGLMMGAALSNWGHGLGWGGGWGWGHETHSGHCNGISHHDLAHYVEDDFNDFDDADYGMDCSGDFGF